MVAPLLRRRSDPAPYDPPSDETIDLARLARHMWGLKWRVLAGTAAVALVVACGALALATRHEALATVIIDGPADLNIEALQLRAKSARVSQRVAAALGGFGSSNGGGQGEWAVVLYPSRTSGSHFLPWLGLSVAADSPERAQAIANVWAQTLASDATLLEPLDGAPDVRQAERIRAEAGLLEAERRLLVVQTRHAEETAQLNARHDLDGRAAELDARKSRVVALEDELTEIQQQLKSVPAGDPRAGTLRARREAVAVQLDRHHAATLSISRAIGEATRAAAALARKQAIEARPLERAVGEAAERHQIAVGRSLGAIRLQLGEAAKMPPGRIERSARAAAVSLPFGWLFCMTVAFLVALSREVRKPSSHSW